MQVYVSLNSAFTRISRDHAIVLLDQRGTGSSSLQSCEYPEEWQQPADPMSVALGIGPADYDEFLSIEAFRFEP